MAAMLIETEATPNPATLKFLPGRIVMDAGTRDFATPEEAEASPLAEMLFALGDVTGVFFGCAGCPSSSATLKNGIEQLLKYYVPEVTEVRAV